MTSTIFEALTAEHRELEGQFRRVLAARSLDIARAMFRTLAGRLLTLLRNERIVVYPHFSGIPGLREEVAVARLEHSEIESAIEHLRFAREPADAWFADAATLHMRLRELRATEECALFPVARLTLATDVARRLADDFDDFASAGAQIANVAITYDLAW
jgi:hypothetical protein